MHIFIGLALLNLTRRLFLERLPPIERWKDLIFQAGFFSLTWYLILKMFFPIQEQIEPWRELLIEKFFY